MLLYRICRAEFATNLNASGFAGRWNQEGQKVLYASATRSLAALEHLANRSGIVVKSPYRVMVLEIQVDSVDSVDSVDQVNKVDQVDQVVQVDLVVPVEMGLSVEAKAMCPVFQRKLPLEWRQLSYYGRLQEIGADWYRRSESLLLRVPSVLIPQESNYLINTQHPNFGSLVKLLEVEKFDWDSRFI